jgi:hypothetical protein
MNNQDIGLLRNTKDKFYTHPHISRLCVNHYRQQVSILDNDLCIEPSAGDGSFIDPIKDLFKKFCFYDIEPNNEAIDTLDFLTFDSNISINNEYENIHVIGNPPFGRQSSMAIKFLKKCATFCNYIGFILPKSFKKDSMRNKIPLNFHIIFEIDLPINSFLVEDNIHDVPSVFQIWEKKDYEREKIIIMKPKNYKFVKQNENPHIAFRRVGGNAGNIYKEIEDKSFQSHYFIKFDNYSNELYDKLKKINYNTKEHTTGPKSIGKQELIKEFNMIT